MYGLMDEWMDCCDGAEGRIYIYLFFRDTCGQRRGRPAFEQVCVGLILRWHWVADFHFGLGRAFGGHGVGWKCGFGHKGTGGVREVENGGLWGGCHDVLNEL